MVVNAITICQKIKNKSSLNIKKDVMKCKKINEQSFNNVSVSSYKSKNGLILSWPRLQLLAIIERRVREFGSRLGQPDAFEMKYIKFLYQAM